MADILKPTCESELAEAIAQAAGNGGRIAIIGGGSKSAIGRACSDAVALDMTGFAGIVDYDPAELVLTVRPGTLLKEVQNLVAEQGQMLAFDPYDHGGATIGGVMAAGISGSQRLSGGGARDHLLGFRAVSGRGEVFVAGAKVVKNVTGYDLPKLATGSWGRLFAIAEMTIKVLPRPRVRASWVVEGLDPETAVRAMARAVGSQAEVSAAAHLPAGVRGARSLTVLRIQGFGPSVDARGAVVEAMLASHGSAARIGEAEGDAIWAAIAGGGALPSQRPLWRICVTPSAGAGVVSAINGAGGGDWHFDWAGGLVWMASDVDAAAIRKVTAQYGGHATLVRADTATYDAVPAFHPQPTALAALEERVRRSFDPASVFETGRF